MDFFFVNQEWRKAQKVSYRFFPAMSIVSNVRTSQ